MADQPIEQVKEYYNKVIDDLNILFREKFRSQEKLAEIIIGYNEKHFELLNSKDKQLREERIQFISRAEHDKLDACIREIERKLAMQEGKASMSAVYIAYAIGGIAILVSIVDLIYRITGR